MIVRIDDLDDTRLAPYRMVADPAALARAGLFAAEGRLVAPRLLASRYRVHSLLVSDAALAALRPVLQTRPELDVLVAPVEIISATGGFDFHRGCLALGYRSDPLELTELLKTDADSLQPIVILEAVSNPDNIGGIFRSAHAFGARVVLGPGCGDPLYRKAIRTSMGATLDVAWAGARGWPEELDVLASRGYRVIALTTDAAAPPLRDALADGDGPVALLLGSEGYGLSPAVLAAARARARIPMRNAGADSLNVAAAASIGLYEVSRL
jgi:tRNA G18 (ribose-2'-O)-methylase SpoU